MSKSGSAETFVGADWGIPRKDGKDAAIYFDYVLESFEIDSDGSQRVTFRPANDTDLLGPFVTVFRCIGRPTPPAPIGRRHRRSPLADPK